MAQKNKKYHIVFEDNENITFRIPKVLSNKEFKKEYITEEKYKEKLRRQEKIEQIKTLQAISIDELRDIVKKKGWAANKRIQKINKSGQYSFAYQVAKNDFLDSQKRKNFRVRTKTMTRQEAMDELKAINKFLNSETSTPAGIKRVKKRQEIGLKNKLYNSIDTKLNENDFNDIVELLRNSYAYQFLHRYISSDEILRIYKNIASSDDYDYINDLLNNINNELKLKTPEERKRTTDIKVKTDEQADLLNRIFGRNIFDYEDIAPKINKTEDNSDELAYS